MENKRKYNSDFRKKLLSKLEKIIVADKEKSECYLIYTMIINDIGNNFSNNRNGIFINMNILSNDCIDKLIQFTDKKIKQPQNQNL